MIDKARSIAVAIMSAIVVTLTVLVGALFVVVIIIVIYGSLTGQTYFVHTPTTQELAATNQSLQSTLQVMQTEMPR